MTPQASRFRFLTIFVIVGICTACGLFCGVRAADEAKRGGSEETQKILRENLDPGSNCEWLLRDQKHDVYLWRTTDDPGIGFDTFSRTVRVYRKQFVKTGLSIPTSVIRDLIVHSAKNGNRAEVISGLVFGEEYSGRQDFIHDIVVKDGTVAPDLLKEIATRYEAALPYAMRLVLHKDGNLYVDLRAWKEKKK